MRVFVTGISGFVGSALARRLLAWGDEVSGTYWGAAPRLPGVVAVEADVRDRAGLGRAIDEADPEVVVHLAGLAHVGDSWQHVPDYFQVNVLGTENVLEAARARRVVFASSAEVYGRVPENEQPIPAERPLAPASPYALTKAAAERLARARGAVVVRSFNAIGAGQDPRFALPGFARQLRRMVRGEQAAQLAVGNLEARRDFLHVDDVGEGYRLLAARGEPGGVYNLATGVARSIADALDALILRSGLEVEVVPDPERLRPVDLPLLCGDAAGARALGWAPARSFDEALDELWEETS